MTAAGRIAATYVEFIAALIAMVTLADWALRTRQHETLTQAAARLWQWIAALKARALVERFTLPHAQTTLLMLAFAIEVILVCGLEHTVGYAGSSGLPTLPDLTAGTAILFFTPLAVSLILLARFGARGIEWIARARTLNRFLGRAALVTFAAGALIVPAVKTMDLTFAAFGPRALLDWWDPRLWLYAAESTICGPFLSAALIGGMLLLAGLVALLLASVLSLLLMQVGLVTRRISDRPSAPLFGASLMLASLASMAKQWMS